jgi:hypothetical protein
MNNPIVQKYQYYLNESNRLAEELKAEQEYIELLEELISILEGKKYGDGPNPYANEPKLPKNGEKPYNHRYLALVNARAERVRRGRAARGEGTTDPKTGIQTGVKWDAIKRFAGDAVDRGYGKQATSRKTRSGQARPSDANVDPKNPPHSREYNWH